MCAAAELRLKFYHLVPHQPSRSDATILAPAFKPGVFIGGIPRRRATPETLRYVEQIVSSVTPVTRLFAVFHTQR